VIAVRAILFAVGVDSPKKHNVNDLLEIAVNDRQNLFSDQFKRALLGMVASLRHLLYLRSISAYGLRNLSAQRILSLFPMKCISPQQIIYPYVQKRLNALTTGNDRQK